MDDQGLPAIASLNRQMDFDQQLRHEEEVATGKISMGVGRHAQKELGMTCAQIADKLKALKQPLSDSSATFIDIDYPLSHKKVRLYLKRNGRFLDVGTRADFREMGWLPICNTLDMQAVMV